MFKRVRADLPFTQEDEAEDFYHDCELALAKATVINPGQPSEERGFIFLEECHHDEDPPKPCQVITAAEAP